MHRPSLYPLSVGGHGVPSFILPKMVQNMPSTARHTGEHLSVGLPEATVGKSNCQTKPFTKGRPCGHTCMHCGTLCISRNVGIVHKVHGIYLRISVYGKYDEVLHVFSG